MFYVMCIISGKYHVKNVPFIRCTFIMVNTLLFDASIYWVSWSLSLTLVVPLIAGHKRVYRLINLNLIG